MDQKSTDFTHEDLEGYDSSFEDDEDKKKEKTKGRELTKKHYQQPNVTLASSAAIPTKEFFEDAQRRAEGFRNRYFALNAFERHQKLINDYFLYFPGAKKLLGRDASKDKRDIDVVRENHRFLWKETDSVDSWEQQLAKAYYDKLYKEYTICDLSRYLENKVAMRWRIEKELLDGKGQFICGAKRCDQSSGLKTWEVNFAYMEEGVKKNALVKLRLCPECSFKLNYGQKRKEKPLTPNQSSKNLMTTWMISSFRI
ncbi:unnamed protein product [Allacma fusca]|uniref:Protein FRA10AC1 n=1 Tax=Allacma fusca TaxID=39272 RepID=A0A8J2LX16_9HEXA|nr:unnamed protein product [Allacma fusca]